MDENGEQLGIMSAAQAQSLADDRQLDLVKIAPTAKPPVCKLMDYSKFRFDSQKKEKEARKNQKTTQLKEVRLSPTIDTHDVEVKAKACTRFLQNGDKVKAVSYTHLSSLRLNTVIIPRISFRRCWAGFVPL